MKSTLQDEALFEQAADWFLRIRAAEADSETHTAWLAWIESDPAHREAFAEIQQAWSAVGEIQSPAWPNPTELAQDRDSFGYPSPIARMQKKQRSAVRYWGLGLAASAALVAFTPFGQTFVAHSWYTLTAQSSQRILTKKGEQYATTLPDGSRIELGGLTGVDVDFTPERRLVKAGEGEVFYKVKKDAARPFIVESGPVRVTALGTAFSIRREREVVTVLVTEGAVEVNTSANSVRAEAGQRVRFDHGKLAATHKAARAGTVEAWKRGQLRFENEPLWVVVANLNRYARKEMVLTDISLNELHFTGVVFDESPDDWLRAVQRLFPVEVREEKDRILIAPRP